MNRAKFLVPIAFVALFTFSGCDKDDVVDPLTTTNYTKLNGAMRTLWADHMQWTFSTIDAYFHDQNGLQPQLNRLLKNQEDIGAAIVPYYGQVAGDTLTSLLKTHIQQAVPVLQAAEAGNQTALNQALANWNANAKHIANFLSAANPAHWPKTEMEQMMGHHISTTTTYAVDLMNEDYANAISHYDEALNHMMEMADKLSRGIALQFPEKF